MLYYTHAKESHLDTISTYQHNNQNDTKNLLCRKKGADPSGSAPYIYPINAEIPQLDGKTIHQFFQILRIAQQLPATRSVFIRNSSYL